MQHALKHVERPGGSHAALDGKTSFTSDELDSLEEFDFGFTNDDGDKPASEDVLVQQPIFPYTEHESQLGTDQLHHCDGSGNGPFEADGCSSPFFVDGANWLSPVTTL